jgi:hypothetical protein
VKEKIKFKEMFYYGCEMRRNENKRKREREKETICHSAIGWQLLLGKVVQTKTLQTVFYYLRDL